jgi:hypothetical protein
MRPDGRGRTGPSDENPQMGQECVDAGHDRRGDRRQDQDAADGAEPADKSGQAVPLQDAERKGRDSPGRRNVAERDRQEEDDGEEKAGPPTIRSGTGWSSRLIRGRRKRSTRCKMGPSFAVRRAKKSREIDRSQMKRGIHRVERPSISWAVMKRSGAPRTADMPGGSGSMLGAAKKSIRAPKPRSPKAFSTSPILMTGTGRAARPLRTSENRCRGSASPSANATVARLLEGSGMVLSIVDHMKQCEWRRSRVRQRFCPGRMGVDLPGTG